MTFNTHVKKLTRSCFFLLRNIRKLRSVVSNSTRDAYTCLYLISLSFLLAMEVCPRSSAGKSECCFKTNRFSNKGSHISPLISPHWLPVVFRIHFQILTLNYRALHSRAPAHVAHLLHPHSSARSLGSNKLHLLSVPHTHLKTRGDRAFKAIASKLWNALPTPLRLADSVDWELKTSLFRQAFR